MNFIKSIIANHYYRKALHYMGISAPALALDSIRKASKWELNEKYMPRYLSLQGELEIGLGDKSKARETFLTAKSIINRHQEFWYSDAQNDIVKRIDASLAGSKGDIL